MRSRNKVPIQSPFFLLKLTHQTPLLCLHPHSVDYFAHRSPLTAHRSPLTAHRSPLTASLLALILVTGTAQAQSQGQNSRWWDQNRNTAPEETPARTTQPTPPSTTRQSSTWQDETRASTSNSTPTKQPVASPTTPISRVHSQLEPAYSWVQLGAIWWIPADDVYESFEGLKFNASLALGQYIYLQAKYENSSFDETDESWINSYRTKSDESRIQLGIGFHDYWFPRTHWYIEGGLLHVHSDYEQISRNLKSGALVDYEKDSGSATGGYLALGFRSRVARVLELWEEQRIYSINGNSTFSVTGGLSFRFSSHVGLVASAEIFNNYGRIDERMLAFDIGLRVSF